MKLIIKKFAGALAVLSLAVALMPAGSVEATSTNFSPSHTVDKQNAKPGEVVTYTLTIKAVADSKEIRAGVSLSPSVELVPGTVTVSKSGYSNTVTLADDFIHNRTFRNLGGVKKGEVLTMKYQAKVKAGVGNGARLQTVAEIKSAEHQTPVPCAAFVNIKAENKPAKKHAYAASKNVDKEVAKRGDILTYTLKAKNTGNDTLTDLYIKEQLPEGVTLVPGSTKLTRNTTVTVTDDWIRDGLNTGNLEPGKLVTVVFKVKVNDDVVNNTVLVNIANFRSNELPDWVRCAEYTKVIVKEKPTPTPEKPTPTPEEPTPTPTKPTGDVKGATPTPTPVPVKELPSTGPGAVVLTAIGGIVSALMGRKYFISR